MCPKFPAMGHLAVLTYQHSKSFTSTYASTMAKCGMVMPREVAISSPGSGWEAVAGAVKLSSNVVKQ
ncbi:MAG: hypothetical protein RBQ82_07470 [Synergistaceae bacterium]|nr:hypothetical protein [Synergistaceae bacterium]